MGNNYEVAGSKISGTFPKNVMQRYGAKNRIEAKKLAEGEGIRVENIKCLGKNLEKKVN